MTTSTRVGIWRVRPDDGSTGDFVGHGRLIAPDVVLTHLPKSDAIVLENGAPKARLGMAASGAEIVEVIDAYHVETQEVPKRDKVLVALRLQRRSCVEAPYDLIEGLPFEINDTDAALSILEYLQRPRKDAEVQTSSEWYSRKRLGAREASGGGDDEGHVYPNMFPPKG